MVSGIPVLLYSVLSLELLEPAAKDKDEMYGKHCVPSSLLDFPDSLPSTEACVNFVLDSNCNKIFKFENSLENGTATLLCSAPFQDFLKQKPRAIIFWVLHIITKVIVIFTKSQAHHLILPQKMLKVWVLMVKKRRS